MKKSIDFRPFFIPHRRPLPPRNGITKPGTEMVPSAAFKPIGLLAVRSLFLAAVVCFCFSCSKTPTINGRVLSATDGEPLAGVAVQIAGSAFTAETDSKGNFTVEFAPGNFAINFRKPGYTAVSHNLSVTTPQDYPLADVGLFRLPESKGITFFGGGRFEALQRADIQVRDRDLSKGRSGMDLLTASDSDSRSYYAIGNAVTVPEGQPLQFIDIDGARNQLFRVLEGGSFIERVYGHLGGKDNLKKIEESVREVNNGVYIRTLPNGLEPGYYVYASLGKDNEFPGFDTLNSGLGSFAVLGQGHPIRHPAYLFKVGGAGDTPEPFDPITAAFEDRFAEARKHADAKEWTEAFLAFHAAHGLKADHPEAGQGLTTSFPEAINHALEAKDWDSAKKLVEIAEEVKVLKSQAADAKKQIPSKQKLAQLEEALSQEDFKSFQRIARYFKPHPEDIAAFDALVRKAGVAQHQIILRQAMESQNLDSAVAILRQSEPWLRETPEIKTLIAQIFAAATDSPLLYSNFFQPAASFTVKGDEVYGLSFTSDGDALHVYHEASGTTIHDTTNLNKIGALPSKSGSRDHVEFLEPFYPDLMIIRIHNSFARQDGFFRNLKTSQYLKVREPESFTHWAFSPDRQIFYTASTNMGGTERGITAIDTATGANRYSISIAPESDPKGKSGYFRIYSLFTDATGKYLYLVSGRDSDREGPYLVKYDASTGKVIEAHPSGINRYAWGMAAPLAPGLIGIFSPEMRGGHFNLYDLAERKITHSWQGSRFHFTNDRKCLAVRSRHSARLNFFSTGAEKSYSQFPGDVDSFALHSRKRLLATADSKGNVTLWRYPASVAEWNIGSGTER